MAGQQLLEVTLADDSKAWFATDAPERTRRLWENARSLGGPNVEESVARATRELTAAGQNLAGYSATSWWLEDPGDGRGEGVYALFRRAEGEPAITVLISEVQSHDEQLAGMREEIRHSCLLCGEHEDDVKARPPLDHFCIYEPRWAPAGPGDAPWSWTRGATR